MDKKLLIIIAFVVIASGCIDPGNGEEKSSIEVEDFTVTDSSLSPNQEAAINLVLRNHNNNEVKFSDISLYGLSFLRDVTSDDACKKDSLEPSREGVSPGMQCSWRIKAPSDIGGFESKATAVNVNMEYTSSMNAGPFKVQFKPLSEITSSEEKTKTFSNGEIKVTLKSETPVPREGGTLEVSIDSQGPGSVVSDYDMSFSPESVMQDCISKHSTAERIVEDEARFSCEIKPGSSGTVARNLVVSTSYKYLQTPSLDIEVVTP